MAPFKGRAVAFGERLKKGFGRVKEGFAKARSFGSKVLKNPFVKGVMDAGVEYAKKNHPQLASAAENIRDTASGKKGLLDGLRDGKAAFGTSEKRKALMGSARDVLGAAAKKGRKDAEHLFNEKSKQVLGGGRGGGGGMGIV